MTTVALTILALGLVLFFTSLPLIYRKISMNHLYGIRIPAAFDSDKQWYDINAYGGRQFSMVSNIMKNKHDTAKNAINNIR